MRRELKIILVTVASGALWTGGSRAAEAVVALDTFRVTDVEVSGTESLVRGDILALMDVTRQSSVWTDTETWEGRLEAHPLLKSAEVQRRIPGTLLVRVVERRPVALAPTPTLEPVDEDGVILPMDPSHRKLDLPILDTPRLPAPGSRLLPSHDRRLAAEVARITAADTAFLQMVSEVALQPDGSVLARWSEPQVDILLAPGAPARRLREALNVLADALGRDPEQAPTVIDLRFADQVVVRRNR